jgi:hypothetical protein
MLIGTCKEIKCDQNEYMWKKDENSPCTYNQKWLWCEGMPCFPCSHISYTLMLAKHPWIVSREWFQSLECKRTHAQGLAWHDRIQHPYTLTRKMKHWKQEKMQQIQNKKNKNGRHTCSSQSWLWTTPQAHEICQVKLNQQICAKINHHCAIC